MQWTRLTDRVVRANRTQAVTPSREVVPRSREHRTPPALLIATPSELGFPQVDCDRFSSSRSVPVDVTCCLSACSLIGHEVAMRIF